MDKQGIFKYALMSYLPQKYLRHASFEAQEADRLIIDFKSGRKYATERAQRFVKAAEELHLSGGRLYRDGIVANEQVLSKIKNGWQKPQKKSIELLCKKYNINAAWLYTGEGDMFLAVIKPFEQHGKRTFPVISSAS